MGPALSILLPWHPYASSFQSLSGLPSSAGIWVCCPGRGERTLNRWQLQLWINLLSGLITKSSWDWLLLSLCSGDWFLSSSISWLSHRTCEACTGGCHPVGPPVRNSGCWPSGFPWSFSCLLGKGQPPSFGSCHRHSQTLGYYSLDSEGPSVFCAGPRKGRACLSHSWSCGRRCWYRWIEHEQSLTLRGTLSFVLQVPFVPAN